jgi:hypothetical protein
MNMPHAQQQLLELLRQSSDAQLAQALDLIATLRHIPASAKHLRGKDAAKTQLKKKGASREDPRRSAER